MTSGMRFEEGDGYFLQVDGFNNRAEVISIDAKYRIVSRVDGLESAIWAEASDMRADDYNLNSNVHSKEHIETISTKSTLDALRGLKVTKWKFKHRSLEEDGLHIGPTSQDFYAAFGLGTDETAMSVGSAIGVLIASIQELAAENDRLKARIDALERRWVGIQ